MELIGKLEEESSVGAIHVALQPNTQQQTFQATDHPSPFNPSN